MRNVSEALASASIEQTEPASCPKQPANELRPPRPDERAYTPASRGPFSLEYVCLALFAAVALAWLTNAFTFNGNWIGREPGDTIAVKALVERIITAESNGDPNAKNKRSSAAGAGQFLDDTWLEAVRAHRRDLLEGRKQDEVLELRRDAALTREIMTRLLQQHAAMLAKRGLPVTPGSLYLAHFAGPAGAVALLTGAEDADAAAVMAAADSTGRTTREKLVSANPFLKVLTARDLKNWANRKMRMS